MCGIAGIARTEIGAVVDAAEIGRMCQTIIHRGPDDEGIYTKGAVGLGMRRLSIIDLSGGRQPIHNEDETVWVVFNGEIYNFPELRVELEKRGHRFYTHTDTEVIVHLYEDYGADCVRKLRGMFAIALYDERQRTLLLARDRLGKKPLHYALARGGLLFGSEIKTILAVAPELKETSLEGLLHYFAVGYVPDPLTAFTRIAKLPPGCLAEFSNGRLTVREYWDLPTYGTHEPESEEECLEELEKRLAEAVRIRLISDVPLGALLSGGTDSSTIVGLMARASSKPVQTFSIGFRNGDYNEADYARIVAKTFGTNHHELIIEPKIGQTLDELTRSLEEPFGDSSILPTYYVSRLARQHVTVALSGDAGDELFAGYDRYPINLRRQVFDLIPAPIGHLYRRHVYPLLPRTVRGRKFAFNISLPTRERFLDGIAFLPSKGRESSLFSDDFVASVANLDDPLDLFRRYFKDAPASDLLSQFLYVDTKTYLTADILAKVDRMSMATSLEVRVPLLDHIFLEWVTRLPSHWKLRDGKQKYIFKRLAERVGVPREVLYRRKQGFSLPLEHWIRGELGDELPQILLEPRTLQRGYFNPASVRRLLKEHLQGRFNHAGRLWQLLILELWHRNFLEAPGALERQLLPTSASTEEFSAEDFSTSAKPDHSLHALKPLEESSSENSDRSETRVGKLHPSAGQPSVFLMINDLQTGGTERQFAALVRALNPEAFRVTLGCLRRRGPLLEGLGHLAEFDVGGSFLTLRGIFARAALARYLRAQGVLIAHSFDFYSNLMLIPVARLGGAKIVIGSHRQLGDLLTPLQFRAQNAVFRLCDRIVCNSRAASARLIDQGLPERKVAVIPNGLSDLAFAETTPSLSPSPGILRVGLIARMNDPVKNHAGFLRAAAQLAQRFPDVEFLLVGDGPLRPELELLAGNLELGPRVRFLGERHDIPGLLAAMDVSVIFSSSESLSNVALESMAAGVPVIATRVGGNPEVVRDGETGFLVAPGSEEGLARSIERLMTQPSLRSEMGRRAKKLARSSFTMDRVAGQFEELYLTLAAEKGLLPRRHCLDAVRVAISPLKEKEELERTALLDS